MTSPTGMAMVRQPGQRDLKNTRQLLLKLTYTLGQILLIQTFMVPGTTRDFGKKVCPPFWGCALCSKRNWADNGVHHQCLLSRASNRSSKYLMWHLKLIIDLCVDGLFINGICEHETQDIYRLVQARSRPLDQHNRARTKSLWFRLYIIFHWKGKRHHAGVCGRTYQ